MSARYAYVGEESFDGLSPERDLHFAGPLLRTASTGSEDSAPGYEAATGLIQPPHQAATNAAASRADQELVALPRRSDDSGRRLASLAPPLLPNDGGHAGSNAASVQSGLDSGGVGPPAFYRSKYFRCGCEVAFILLAVILAFLAGSASQSPSTSSSSPGESPICPPTNATTLKRPPVIVVSFDGLRADYLDLAIASSRPLPHFTAMRQNRRGIVADGMRPSFPSLTFPNHMTLVTGVHPETHGITANHIYDPTDDETFLYTSHATQGPEWFESETAWTWADRFNVSTGTVMWVGSETLIHGLQPNVWLPYSDAMPNAARVAKVFEWIDADQCELCLVYFSDVDTAGHTYGAATPQVLDAVAAMDSIVGLIQAGLTQRHLQDTASLVVVSDHGMATISGQIFLDDFISLTAHGITHQETGAFTNIWLPEPIDATVVDQLMANLTRADHMTCWRKEDTPEEYHYQASPRIAPINCLCSLGYVTTSRDPLSSWSFDPQEKGCHGYDPSLPEMHAIFLAQSPKFDSGRDGRAGVVQETSNRNVLNLLCHLLDVSPPPNNGSILDFAPFLLRA